MQFLERNYGATRDVQQSTHPIGELIRQKRENLGITQRDCAKYLGLSSPQYISNIERGLCGPSVETLAKLGSYLKIDTTKIIESMVDAYRTSLRERLRQSKPRRKSS